MVGTCSLDFLQFIGIFLKYLVRKFIFQLRIVHIYHTKNLLPPKFNLNTIIIKCAFDSALTSASSSILFAYYFTKSASQSKVLILYSIFSFMLSSIHLGPSCLDSHINCYPWCTVLQLMLEYVCLYRTDTSLRGHIVNQDF